MKNVVKAIDICLGHGVCNDCPYCFSGKGYTTMNCRDYMMRDVLALLKEQEQIVRCKDCRWYSEKGFCKHPNGGAGNIRPADWYCADGVKKDD